MKLLLFAQMLFIALVGAGAAEPDFYQLVSRWRDRAVADVEADAARGDMSARCYLGRCLVSGHGVPRDSERGLALLRQAIAQGSNEASVELARCHYLGLGVPVNHAEAARLARVAADAGNASGMALMAVFHGAGVGVPVDGEAALRLHQAAAAAGSPVAMRNLGGVHLDGKYGLARDPVEANRWFLRAAQAGLPRGMIAYGYSLLKGRGIATDEPAGVRWLLRAAHAGDAEGLRFIPRAAVDAQLMSVAWRAAAHLGDADAQFHLAQLIARGELEARGAEDHPHHLLEAAAEGEVVEAALMLGDRYRWGYAGPRDLVAAARWFLHGASFVGGLGDTAAKVRVHTATEDPALVGGLNNWFQYPDWKARRKDPGDAALAAAMDLYLRAARRRDAEAMREIAALYQRGQHAPADAREAVAWLLLARQTNPAVAADADAALQSLPPEQRQPARDRVRHLLKRTL